MSAVLESAGHQNHPAVTGKPLRWLQAEATIELLAALLPLLSFAQRRAGRELGSTTAVADSKQTLLCAYLSAAVLVGLVLNAALGWWWADPVAGLVKAVLAVREGRNA